MDFLNDSPCSNCIIKTMCECCCLDHQLFTNNLNHNEKLKYLDYTRNDMKTASPQVRKEFNKIKYGMEFA